MSLVIIVFFLLTLIEGYNTYLDVLHNTISTFLIEDYIFDGLNYLILKTEIGVEADQYIFKTDVPYNHINNLSDTVYALLEKQKNIEDNKQYIFSSLTKEKGFITCNTLVPQYGAYLLAFDNTTNFTSMLLTICDTFNAERYIDYDKNYNEALYFIQVKNNYFSELTYTNLFSIHYDMAIYITIMLLFFRPLSQIIRDSMSIPLLLKYADSYIECAWLYTVGSIVLTIVLAKVFVISNINKRYDSLNLLSKAFFIAN